jgi:hypothetical protein
MKKQVLFLIASFIISVAFSLPDLNGQDKTKNSKDKDAEIQKSIEEQKKAMSDQKKTQMEIEYQDVSDKAMDEAKMELDNANNERNKIFMMMPRGNRSFNFNTYEDMTGFYGHMGDEERTTWDFSKTVKENTFSRDYSFDVEKSAKSVVMSVMGDCKAGEIRIKIIMPNGKSYSDILIDESGNLNWRKSFQISDSENQDKTGDWKFQISSTKATGFFKISLQTF